MATNIEYGTTFNGTSFKKVRADDGFINPVQVSVAATGTNIATATVVSAAYIRIATGTSTQGIRFKSFEPGQHYVVRNATAKSVRMYPPSSVARLNDTTSVASVFIPANTTRAIYVITSTQGYTL